MTVEKVGNVKTQWQPTFLVDDWRNKTLSLTKVYNVLRQVFMPIYLTRCTASTSIWNKYTIFLHRYKEVDNSSSLERMNEQKA